jgi:HlyD family secretion protein
MKTARRFAPCLAALAFVLFAGCSAGPPEVRFERVRREQIVSTLTTNGRVEPAAWSAARAEREGVIAAVRIRQGDRVARGAVLAEIRAQDSEASVKAAEAQLAQAQAELARYERGGDPAQLAEIDAALQKHRQDRAVAVREAAAVERLLARGAATKQELQAQRDRMAALDVEIQGLERRRAVLLTQEGRAAAEARKKDAEAALDLAKKKSELTTVRAPESGAAFHVAVKAGAFVRPGDLIAEVGNVDLLRLVIYVDEPELGRVAPGMPVRVTWDAAPGRHWAGKIESLPAQIVAQGSRQVGEVLCTIDNESRQLPPGANVNVEVQSRVVDGALSIPKESLQRQKGELGVYVIEGTKLVWRALKTGVTSVTRAEVTSGLKEGDAVALPGGAALSEGLEVRPVN